MQQLDNVTMSEKIKKRVKYESVRVYDDKKIRIEKIVAKRSLSERKVTEVGVLDEILDKELPKVERKLGI